MTNNDSSDIDIAVTRSNTVEIKVSKKFHDYVDYFMFETNSEHAN